MWIQLALVTIFSQLDSIQSSKLIPYFQPPHPFRRTFMTYLKIIAALWALTFLLAIVGCFQPLQSVALQQRSEKLSAAPMFGFM